LAGIPFVGILEKIDDAPSRAAADFSASSPFSMVLEVHRPDTIIVDGVD
jgi:hypothetical protein